MSAVEQTKKRKRTGKEREERKKAAEEAKANADKLVAEARDVDVLEQDLAPATLSISDAPDDLTTELVESVAAKGPDIEGIVKRTPQALKSLNPFLKQARIAETQRLVKKIRLIRSKNPSSAELKDLEPQLEMMHHINLHDIAQTHLSTKLSKHHHFKHSSLPSSLVALLTPSASAGSSTDAEVRAKVENRLCSNKSVAEGVRGVVKWVMGDEGAKLAQRGQVKKAVPAKVSGGGKGKPGVVAVDVDDEEEEEEEGEEEGVLEGGEEGNESGLEEPANEEDLAADAAGWESGSLRGDSDEEEPDSDEDDKSDAPAQPSKRPKQSIAAKQTKPTKATQVIKREPKSTSASTPAISTKGKATKAQNANITSSLFLPSLSVGFTPGDDSDSDPDMDDDLGGAGVIGKKGAGAGERKNRRGQRARQAIWEKKYGRNAKHVIKGEVEAKKKEEGMVQKEMQRAYGKRAGQGPGQSAGSGVSVPLKAEEATMGGASRSIATTTPTRPTGFAPSKPAPAPAPAAGGSGLHPSWEAARLRQKQLAAVPAATKIVFD